MKVIFNDNFLLEVPDNLSANDTIMYQNSIYLITSKTWDHDNNEFYCKVILYEEEPQDDAVSIISKIYDSDYFETSGFNTNDVNDNPRLFVLLTIIAVIVGNDYMKINGHIYKQNILSMWNRKNIPFDEIINDYPKIACSDINKICKSATILLEMNKIARNIWPKFLNDYGHSNI